MVSQLSTNNSAKNRAPYKQQLNLRDEWNHWVHSNTKALYGTKCNCKSLKCGYILSTPIRRK